MCAMISWLELLWHFYHMVYILLELESWSTTLVLGRQWILKEIWGIILFYVFLCAWNFLVDFFPILLYLSWHFSCQCRGTNKNGTNDWGLVLEKLLVSTVNNTGELAIVSSRSCQILFIQLKLKFPSNRGDFLVEMCILLSLVIFRPCRRGAKVGNKSNNKLSQKLFRAVTHTVPIVWLVV